jgi:hypothetical protein
MCLYKAKILSRRLRRSVTLEIVHEVCAILTELGWSGGHEDTVRWCEEAPEEELEMVYAEAARRLRRRRRRLLDDAAERYALSYIA